MRTTGTIALNQPRAINGLGGVGKTQLALEYAYRYDQEYQAILWAQAESVESLNSSYIEIASQIDEVAEKIKWLQQDGAKQDVIVQTVKDWLHSHDNWLLILDNADEPALVRPFLPTKYSGHVLLTTRAQALGKLARPLEVASLDEEDGALLLLRRAGLIEQDAALDAASPADRALATELTKELGGLPLALDQAGAYIEATGCSLTEYQQRYRKRKMELLALRSGPTGSENDPDDDHPDSVAVTWSLSFAKVAQASPLAVCLLLACAFMAPDVITKDLLLEVAKTLIVSPDASSDTENSQLQQSVSPTSEGEDVDVAIGILRRYSLIQRKSDKQTMHIHRLVQVVLRETLDEQAQNRWITRVIYAVSQCIPDVHFESWEQCELYLPQSLACYEWMVQRHLQSLAGAAVLNRAAIYLNERARYSEAEPLCEKALVIVEEQLGEEHLETATNLNNLAILYINQGRYGEAEPLLKRALAIREKMLGEEHQGTAAILNSLASLYVKKKKYKDAEFLLERVLEVVERKLGEEHLDTVTSMNNLAALYAMQEKYEEAEPLCKRALAIWEKTLGKDHPKTARCLSNLATLYERQKRYKEAEPLFQRVLEIEKKELGEEHPDTATGLNNLALLYVDQGRDKEAELLYKRVLAIDEKKLGEEHPDTVASLNSLATLYVKQKKYEEAESLFKKTLEIRKKMLGEEHPDTVASLNGLISLYMKQEKYEEVESLLEKKLREEHPETATSLRNLAGLYVNQRRYGEAVPLFQRVLAISEKELGKNHPETAKVLNNLALLYMEQGKHEEAELLYKKALVIWDETLGEAHPGAVESLSNLAYLYMNQGRYEEAEPLYKKALAIMEQVVGEERPDMAACLNNLADLYMKQRRYEEAEPLLQKALAIAERTLGSNHPTTEIFQDNYRFLLEGWKPNEDTSH